jgi:hypothetical protein
MGEVARQTPAQAQLRPTCAGAFCVILTFAVIFVLKACRTNSGE